MKLFLDDLRSPPDATWQVARSYDAALWLIENIGHPCIEISFDHDLGDNVPSGYDFAKALIELDMDGIFELSRVKRFHVHSANPVGALNITSILRSYFRFTYPDLNIPFVTSDISP